MSEHETNLGINVKDQALNHTNRTDIKYIQDEVNQLLKDKDVQDCLQESRDKLKSIIDKICPSWKETLVDDGLHRIYDVDTSCGYYVSTHYYKQVCSGKVNLKYSIKD